MSISVTQPRSFPETVIGRCREGYKVRLVSLVEDEGLRLAQVFSKIAPWHDYAISPDKLGRYLASVEPGAARLGIVVCKRVVGVAGLRFNWLRGPYLQFLGIEPEFQGRGLGGLVMAWIEAEARVRDCANVWVMVSHMEGSARPFYEAHGFVKECEIKDLVVEGRHETLMRKRLKA